MNGSESSSAIAMKVPEPLFVIVNPLMKLLLHSPLHFIMSRGLLVLEFTGRKSGRQFSTPLRYQRDADTIRCFTSRDTNWWRNLRGGAAVGLRLAGRQVRCEAQVLAADHPERADLLRRYLKEFPGDAVYHEVALNPDKSPKEADLQAALATLVIVEMKLADSHQPKPA